MTIVLDASVALKWVLREDGTEAARALRGQELVAPAHWLVEASNTLWHYVQTKRLEHSQALASLNELLVAPVKSISERDDLLHAFDIAVRLKHAVYDCLYLALAIRNDTYVITADTRFVGACVREGTWRRHVQLLAGT